MSEEIDRWTNKIILGECVEVMDSLPNNSIDMIFADPPYNLQLEKELFRPNNSRVEGVSESWDQFDSFTSYDKFTLSWLSSVSFIVAVKPAISAITSYQFKAAKVRNGTC